MERIADVSATAKQDRGKPMPSRVRAALWVTLVMLLAASPAAADIAIGAVTIRDGSGNSAGTIDADGTVRNSSGNSVGKIEASGTIRNGSGNSTGKVESDGTVRSP